MTGVVCSAPGKVVLSGEYAVLGGAPAVSMAVDCRAKVRVGYLDAGWNRVIAPGYTSVEGRFVSEGASLEWLQGEDEFRLVDAAWRTLRPIDKGGLSIELDTRAFFDVASGKKFGLGSSAALTVALVAALTRSNDVLDSATRVHRLFQHGAGSGVDIATGVSGGLIEYHMKDASILPLHWPDGLVYRLIWTGVPASTGIKLDRLKGASHRRSRDVLAKAATSMAAAWRSASGIISRFPAYIEALRQFSEEYDLGIFDAGHDKLATEAAAAGLVYKPCGAGGGDVGILLGKSNEQLDEFVIGMDAFGSRPLDCELDINGVDWERH